MPRKAVELGPLAVSRLRKPGLYSVGGAAGLALQVSPSGARSWILNISIGGKRREMGLGSFPGVPLADAREAVREARAKVAAGIDPIMERKAARSALAAAAAAAWSFDKCSRAYVEAMSAKWTAAHELAWTQSLATHASPVLGNLLVRDIGLPHVLQALEPIWSTKTETAARVRGRIESVLDWATTRGYRSEGTNPARWKGHLDTILPAASRVKKVRHFPALPVSDAAAFMAALRLESGIAARALEFAILTAARSGEIRGATWSEVDLDAAMWIIPAERMKMDKEHRVPLSSPAVKLIRALPVGKPSAPLFLSPRGVGPLSSAGMSDLIERLNAGDDGPRWVDAKDGREIVQHGFRATFRTWASELTNYPRDVVEMALAHAIGDPTEEAYRRGDVLEKRRRLMSAWAVFCAKVETKAANVIAMRR